jgi:hypothetical protein
MHKPFPYDPVLSSKAASFLVGLSKPKQKKVVALPFQIAEQLGDYATREGSDREIQHLRLGDWHFSFWPDHATRELWVTEIAEL